MYTTNHLYVIAILGPAGAGKSTTAELLKNELVNTAHVSSDHIKRYVSQFKEVESHNQVSRDVTNAIIAEYLKNGINTVVDQGMTREQLETLHQIATRHDARFLVYRIEADPTVRTARIIERATRINQPMMDQGTMDILSKIYKENDYPATATFDSGEHSTREIVDSILQRLRSN